MQNLAEKYALQSSDLKLCQITNLMTSLNRFPGLPMMANPSSIHHIEQFGIGTHALASLPS